MQLQRRADLFLARKITIVLAVFLFWLGSFGVFFRDVLFVHSGNEPTLSAEQRQEINDRKLAKRREMTARLVAAMGEAKKQPEKSDEVRASELSAAEKSRGPERSSTLSAGWVAVFDPWGHQVARIRAALFGDGWLALPTRAAYAGYQWVFYRDGGATTEIAGGNWRPGEAIGLWHLASTIPDADSLTLAPWSDGVPLVWMSLDSQHELADVRLVPVQRQGDFVVCAIPDAIRENGVFIQDNAIVGWSFGPWLDSVYLWGGKPGTELKAVTDVRAFYAATFARGREEKFAMALAIKGDHADLQRFAALVEGFALQPKLALADTPEYLRSTEVVKMLRQLSLQLVRAGQGARLAEVLTDALLRQIGDLALFMDLIPAITARFGFESAIHKIEGVGRELVDKGGVDVPAVNELHLKLYQDWLQTLITAREVAEATQVLAKAKAFYPKEPYLHLLGVELALLNNDWQEAERLLGMMEYPTQYRDRSELLARQISEMKGDEGTIVLRFPAGGNRIPIAAGLNQSIRQEFIVDTGASMVTIPSTTAEALNLQVVSGDYHGGRRSVSTAGGVVSAYEVVIETLEIEGWEEHNVSALVMDIPDQPGVGLLGLNYLGRFKMDLNNNEGKLLLRPK